MSRITSNAALLESAREAYKRGTTCAEWARTNGINRADAREMWDAVRANPSPERVPAKPPCAYQKICDHCGRAFTANAKKQRFCGDKCSREHFAELLKGVGIC